jgi:predicted nucleotidyltransferase
MLASARSALAVLVSASRDGRLDEICERFDVAVMSAFGSAIVDSSIEPNDLDVGVIFRRDAAPGTTKRRLELWSALVDLVGYEAVDLVNLDVDNPVLRAEALTGMPLYEYVRGEYAEAQIAAVGERRDTAAMRRRNLELMAQ